MSLAIRCPNKDCGRLVRVAAELRGQRIACPACGAGLRIPAARTTQAAPANLDDTPPDLEAIPDTSDSPPVRKPVVIETDETMADKAAAATSALSPIVKLIIVLLFLGGIVWASTQYIFPMLWAKKSVSSNAISELEKQEAEAKRIADEKRAKQQPLDSTTRSTIDAAIERGDVVEARRLLNQLRKNGMILESDLTPLEASYQSALARRLAADHTKLDGLINSKSWDDANIMLSALRDMDPTVASSERYKGAEKRVRGGQVESRLDRAAEQWANEDYDAAMETLTLARGIDKSDRRIEDRRREYAQAMQSGIRFKVAGDVPADVYLDGKKIGSTDRTIWKLPPHKRLTFLLKAPNRIPREVRETLAPDLAKPVQVVLAPAMPDALWAAHLMKEDSAKWLAAAALVADDPAIEGFATTVESRTRAIKPNEKKKTVWLVTRKDGSEVHAIEYSTLGNTIRYVEVESGQTIKCTKDDVAEARKLTEGEGVQRWMTGLAARAKAAGDPCASIRQMADFVEMYPNAMSLLLEQHGDTIRAWVREVAELQSCAPGAGRRSEMEPVKRVAAELSAWKAIHLVPPETLVQQSRATP